MSWGRHPRLATFVLLGSSFTLVGAITQRTQLAAAETDPHRDQRADTAEKTPSPTSDSSALVKAENDSTTETGPSAAQPGATDFSAPLPMPIPAALALPSAEHLSALDQAYLDAFSILKQDNTCSRFYGGPPVIQVLNELKNQLKTTSLQSGIAVKMSGTTTSFFSMKYRLSYRLFDKAELNLRGAFYKGNTVHHDQTVPAIGIYAPNSREARVTILLHELAHLVAKSPNSWLLPNDGNDAFLSHKNTEQIIGVCGEQIRQLERTSFESELESLQNATR